MTQEELEIKFDEAFDKNTKPTGGGYEADMTSSHGLWNDLLPIIMQFAKEYNESICPECKGSGKVK